MTVAWDYANTVGVDAQLSLLLDPLSIFMALVVSGVSTLIHLYSVSYMASDRGYTRFFAYLNFFVFCMLLLVLAGELLLPDRRLGVRRRGVLPADLVLVPARDGDAAPASRRSSSTSSATSASCSGRTSSSSRSARSTSSARSRRAGRVRAQRRRPRRRLPAAARRRVREVRAGPAAHLAPGRDGGPDAGLRPDPRRHDGDRGRLPDRAHAPVLRAGAGGGRRRRDHRLR